MALGQPRETIEYRQHHYDSRSGYRNAGDGYGGDDVHYPVRLPGEEVPEGDPKNHLFLKKMVDILDIVERIIDIELQLGTLAKLEPDLLRKLIADCLGRSIDALYHVLGLVRRKNRQIGAGDRKVGSHAHGTHRNDDTVGFSCLKTEYFAQLLLKQTRYFGLAGSFHFVIFVRFRRDVSQSRCIYNTSSAAKLAKFLRKGKF